MKTVMNLQVFMFISFSKRSMNFVNVVIVSFLFCFYVIVFIILIVRY